MYAVRTYSLVTTDTGTERWIIIPGVTMVTFAVQWTRAKLEIYVLKMTINVAPGHSFVDDCEFEMSVRRTLG